MDGKGDVETSHHLLQRPGGEGAIHLILFVPNLPGETRPLLLSSSAIAASRTSIQLPREEVPFWPAEELVSR